MTVQDGILIKINVCSSDQRPKVEKMEIKNLLKNRADIWRL